MSIVLERTQWYWIVMSYPQAKIKHDINCHSDPKLLNYDYP